MEQSPIFTRTYDLLRWLLPATAKFPREHRFVLAEALQRNAFRLQEALIDAGLNHRRRDALKTADSALTALRTYLRLAHDLKMVPPRRYQHGARQLDEIGRLLGGWMRGQNAGQAE